MSTFFQKQYKEDSIWEKPAWAKAGGQGILKSTGKAEAMKSNGDLAAPITNIRDHLETKQRIKEQQRLVEREQFSVLS